MRLHATQFKEAADKKAREKAAEANQKIEEKKLEANKKLATMAMEFLSEALPAFEAKLKKAELDAFVSESCNLLLKQAKELLAASASTITAGTEFPKTANEVRNLQSDMQGKLRTSFVLTQGAVTTAPSTKL